VDSFIDLEQAICQVADWCGDDQRKLAALYYITTSVSQVDAGRIAGLPIQVSDGRLRCHRLRYWVKLVLQQLQAVLKEYRPLEPDRNDWQNQLKNGETQPVVILAKKYADDSFKLLALYLLTTRVARDTAVRELGIDESKIWYAMKQLRQELRCLYASRIRYQH
jgi:hypothetical protein